MIKYDIYQLWPKFMLRDRNGYAMAKALEAGINYFLRKCQEGIDTVLDVEKMPEWRLDEMAWELNCLYDANADIDTKRGWIRTALPYYSLYGTPEIVRKYISAAYDNVDVEEAWETGGDPYHFNISVDGLWTPEKYEWIQRAVGKTKNVRSILDKIVFNSGKSDAEISAAAAAPSVDIRIRSVTI